MNTHWLILFGSFGVLFAISGIAKSLKADETFKTLEYFLGMIFLVWGIYSKIRKMNSVALTNY